MAQNGPCTFLSGKAIQGIIDKKADADVAKAAAIAACHSDNLRLERWNSHPATNDLPVPLHKQNDVPTTPIFARAASVTVVAPQCETYCTCSLNG